MVLGATGLLGGAVAHFLKVAGFDVRLLSRKALPTREKFPDPFEVVEGDGLNQRDVEEALQGCDGVHISVDHPQEGECVSSVVRACQAVGVKRITYVSGVTVCEENRWFPLVERKFQSEKTLRESGLDYTIFCPGWFMEMVWRFVKGDRAVVFGRPSRHWHFLAVEDFGRMVVESYINEEARGKRLYIHGPEALTVREAVELYCRILHPEIKKVRPVPYFMLHLIAWFKGNKLMKRGIEMVSYLEKVGERGDPTEANSILGKPQITLEEWLQEKKKVQP